jgi:hypothetical protein
LYDAKPGSISFMSLVNLPLSMSLKDLVAKHEDALQKRDDGIFALSNPNRQRWGFFDVVAISPHGVKTAEAVMARGLERIWGKEKADAFLKAIYRPNPQFVPGMLAAWRKVLFFFFFFVLLYFISSSFVT